MIHLKTLDIRKVKTKTLALPVCQDKAIYSDQTLIKLVEQAKKLKEFSGKSGDEITLYHLPEANIDRIVFIGLGKHDEIKLDTLRSLCGKIVQKCMKLKLSEVAITVPDPEHFDLDQKHFFTAMMEGGCLGNHLFDKYKQEKKQKPLKHIYYLTEKKYVKKYALLSSKIIAVCQGTHLARNWVNTPSNDKRPEQFADAIAAEAKKADLKVTILDEKYLKRHKFGSLLAVASGSTAKPRIVVLSYYSKAAKKKIALVGKGVTFDSGGINLKPTGSLEDMKIDMSGAAAVAATLISAAKLRPKCSLFGVIPIVENMLSGSAVRPGDIITSYDGKTVEIGNTDAEGRLILIDAISYIIKKQQPDVIIDLATLTGACVVALGEKIAGVFSEDDALANAIVESGERTFERCWRMPLPVDYAEQLKSEIADLSNMGKTRWGGAITAALFLKEFVGDTRWAHIDIAGPASSKKASNYCGAGGTGFGVRLILDVLEKL